MAEWWQAAVVAALGGGGGVGILGLVRDVTKARRATVPTSISSEARDSFYADRSMAAVVRAMDELAEENARLRAVHAQREIEHEVERAKLRAEIDRLYDQLQRERQEAARRYDALLARVQQLQRRTNPPTPPAGTKPEEE